MFAANDENCLAWLKEQYPTEKNIVNLLKISGNAPLKIKDYIDNNFLTLRDQILNHLDQLSQRRANPIAPVPQWLKQSNDFIFQALILLCIDISRFQANISDRLFNDDKLDIISRVAKNIKPIQLYKFMDFILEKKSMLSRGINLNQQLLPENIFIEFGVLQDNHSVGSVLSTTNGLCGQ